MRHNCCPICSGPLVGSEVRWIKSAQVIAWENGAARLSIFEACFFDPLWQARDSGGFVSSTDLVRLVYGPNPAKHPRNASQLLAHFAQKLRTRLLGSGITIRGKVKSGYRIQAESTLGSATRRPKLAA